METTWERELSEEEMELVGGGGWFVRLLFIAAGAYAGEEAGALGGLLVGGPVGMIIGGGVGAVAGGAAGNALAKKVKA